MNPRGEGEPVESGARTILVVDDEDPFRERLVRALERRGFEVWSAASVGEAEERIARETPEYAVVDLRIANGSGLALLRRLRSLDPTTRVVMLTGYGSIATALEAVRSGAIHYLTKPVDIEELLTAFDPGPATAEELPPSTVPSLHRVEWEHIERVLASCGGNITQAARLLGLHRRSLQRKLAKYPWPR